MAKVVLFMTMSLDGFIAGPDDTVSEPAGRGGERLFAWSDEELASKAVHAEYNATGAVLAGRRTYDVVNGWGGDHHDGVPMFILTHQPPREVPEGAGTYTFVTDGVESAVTQARAAAGDKDVLLHGADITQQCLRAGLLDEMVIHLMPVLLGEGRRLFDHLGSEHVELDLVELREAPHATHLRYRVVQPA
jgi:dihydrofolate reductase